MDRLIRTFIMVANLGSLRQAAKALGISQPAVSKQMRLLEYEIGVGLLHRDSRGVSLTPAGQVLLERTRGLYECVDSILKEVASQARTPQGKLVIGAVETFKNITELWETIGNFATSYPSVSIKLHTEYSVDIVRRVQNGEYDLGIVHDNTPHSADVDWHVLARDRLCIAYHRDKFDRRVIERFPAWQNGPQLITFGADSSLGRLIQHYSERYSIPVRIEVNSLGYLEYAVLRGYGVALVPEGFPLLKNLDSGLCYYTPPGLTVLRGNVLIRRKRVRPSLQAQLFVDMLLLRIGALESGRMGGPR